jgi:hypothetical protein
MLNREKSLSQLSILDGCILLLLFISAFAIRLHNITSPPLDFIPVRQYRQAHITRGYYYDTLDSIPEWKKDMAKLNEKRMGFLLEPRILEHMALAGYHIIGKEDLRIPRILSAVFWMIGGIFLFLIAKQIASSGAALFSTAFYLFLPFGISASRSFQPDPMMTMMFLCSLYAVLHHHMEPSKCKLLIAVVTSAIAIIIKPYCIFLIFCAYIALSILRRENLKLLILHFLVFSVLSFLPAAIHYFSGIFSGVGFLQEHAQVSFLPGLLMKPYFWSDWLKMIGHVIGYLPFIASIIGMFMFRDQVSRALLLGLWIGYVFFGLFFTYHIHTHAYYQMLLIPVVALSLGPLGSMVLKKMTSGNFKFISIILLLVVSIGTGLGFRQIQLSDHKNKIRTVSSVIGVNPEFRKFITDDFKKELKIAEEIGEIVEHSTNTVLLTPYYGRYISYHGEVSGLPWPITFSLQGRKERGLKIPPKEELFNTRYLTIRTHGKYIKYTPDYFIITAFGEFEEQSELKNFLRSNFPVLAKSDHYLIYDTRKMSEEKE